MNARKKLEREVEQMLDKLKERGLLDDAISKVYADGAKRALGRMTLVEVAHMHTVCKQALTTGQPLKIRKN